MPCGHVQQPDRTGQAQRVLALPRGHVPEPGGANEVLGVPGERVERRGLRRLQAVLDETSRGLAAPLPE